MKHVLFTLVLLTAFANATSACPMCKDSIANNEGSTDLRNAQNADGQNISAGMNNSVYVMLGTLFAVMGGVSMVIVKGIRGSNAAGSPRPPAEKQDRDGTL